MKNNVCELNLQGGGGWPQSAITDFFLKINRKIKLYYSPVYLQLMDHFRGEFGSQAPLLRTV